MKTNKLIENIKKALMGNEQETLFVEKSDEALKIACIEYLKFLGYKVLEGPKYDTPVKDLYALISQFYQLLDGIPKTATPSSYRNFGRDLGIAKKFIESRKLASGFSEELAIKECSAIISTFFKHLDEFNIKGPIRFELFTQDKFGWITEKTIYIMKNEAIDYSDKLFEERLKKIEEELSDEYETGYDLDKILERMDKE